MGRPIFLKNGPAHSFPGEKTDWGEIPACYRYQAVCKDHQQTTQLVASKEMVNKVGRIRPPDKSVYLKIIFFISHPKHMLSQ